MIITHTYIHTTPSLCTIILPSRYNDFNDVPQVMRDHSVFICSALLSSSIIRTHTRIPQAGIISDVPRRTPHRQ